MGRFERDLLGKIIGLGNETNMGIDGKGGVKDEAKVSYGFCKWVYKWSHSLIQQGYKITYFGERKLFQYWTCVVQDVSEISDG